MTSQKPSGSPEPSGVDVEGALLAMARDAHRRAIEATARLLADLDDEPLTWVERWHRFQVNVLWWFKPIVAMRRGRKAWSRWFPSRKLCLHDWCFRKALPRNHACQMHHDALLLRRATRAEP